MEDFKLDFIGVGAAKAGTTWLSECLREHPQVCMSDPKELNYFCTKHLWPKLATNQDEGEKWLQARFSHCSAEQIRGEISTSYLVDPSSARLMRERFPDAKVIISLRKPVDSLYSLYYQVARQHSVPPTVEDFIADYDFVIQYGFYYTHTMRFLDWFPMEQLHFVVFDDICNDPERVIVGLFGFLDVATAWRPANLYQRVNVRRVPRVVLIRDVIGAARELLNSSPKALRMRKILRLLGLHHVGDWIQERNSRAGRLPPMRQETRDRLLAAYSEENILLGKLLDRDLSHWNE